MWAAFGLLSAALAVLVMSARVLFGVDRARLAGTHCLRSSLSDLTSLGLSRPSTPGALWRNLSST